ncbi:MAG: pilus assembly protein [Chloroflexi bacterium]|nr:pilus assembly protein [Chloroflexota bacterium]
MVYVARLLQRRLNSQRGAYLVQFAVLLPVLLISVVGGFEVWKIVSLKTSLHNGVYQSARYLALNAPNSFSTDPWQLLAHDFIGRVIGDSAFEKSIQGWDVLIEPPGNPSSNGSVCSYRFTVHATMRIAVNIPFLSDGVTVQDSVSGIPIC